jgi:ACGX-repeat protein
LFLGKQDSPPDTIALSGKLCKSQLPSSRLPFCAYVIKKCVLFFRSRICYSKLATRHKPKKILLQEETKMALANIEGWNENNQVSAACGTACGASDKPQEKPAACGTACGASDKPEEKPAACGTACGASDK